MEQKVRKADEKDAERIGFVHYTGWQETYPGQIDAHYLASRSLKNSEEIFRKSQCKDVLVLLQQEEIVGFAGYGPARDSDLKSGWGEIYGIYVLKKAQRQGGGRMLLQEAQKALRDQGFSQCVLWVLDTNQKALDFYCAMGFQWDGTEKISCLGSPVRELRMASQWGNSLNEKQGNLSPMKK